MTSRFIALLCASATAAVIDADGSYLGKYRKNHIPDVNPGFFEKMFAPLGLKKIQGEVLANLKKELEGSA